MALPTPVLSDGDIVEVQSSSDESAKLIWNTWSQDPTKAAVLQSILYCRARTYYYYYRHFYAVISVALGQNRVSSLHHSSLEVEGAHYPNGSRIPPKLRITSLSCFHILTPGSSNINVPKKKSCTWVIPIKHHGPSGASRSDTHAEWFLRFLTAEVV